MPNTRRRLIKLLFLAPTLNLFGKFEKLEQETLPTAARGVTKVREGQAPAKSGLRRLAMLEYGTPPFLREIQLQFTSMTFFIG